MADVLPGRVRQARVCPACARDWVGLVRDDCPVCQGEGRLALGRGAMEKHGPEVASLAVEEALETRARMDLGAGLDMGQARANQTLTVEKMRKVGLLAPTDAARPGKLRVLTAPQVEARRALPGEGNNGAGPLEVDAGRWTSADRPASNMSGFLCGTYVNRLVLADDDQKSVLAPRGGMRGNGVHDQLHLW